MLLAVLGDSLTQGFPFGERVSWLEVVREKLQITVQNHGVCGETTAEMGRRLKGILMQEDLTHLLIFGGANDLLLESRPVEKILQDILSMQKEGLQKGVKTGCILPLLPAMDYCQNDFSRLRALIKEKSFCEVFVTDWQPALKTQENRINYLNDGVHLTIEGNNNLGNYASTLLKEWLK